MVSKLMNLKVILGYFNMISHYYQIYEHTFIHVSKLAKINYNNFSKAETISQQTWKVVWIL
jgi:hypothetical protein